MSGLGAVESDSANRAYRRTETTPANPLCPLEHRRVEADAQWIHDRKKLTPAEAVHPKLDWANLRLHYDDIAYCIEWHDQIWPVSGKPERVVAEPLKPYTAATAKRDQKANSREQLMRKRSEKSRERRT